MCYVYLLKSTKDRQLYLGSTTDLSRRRIEEHNRGQVFSTRGRLPLELVYYEAYRSERDARHRESSLKLRSNAYTQLKSRISESLR